MIEYSQPENNKTLQAITRLTTYLAELRFHSAILSVTHGLPVLVVGKNGSNSWYFSQLFLMLYVSIKSYLFILID